MAPEHLGVSGEIPNFDFLPQISLARFYSPMHRPHGTITLSANKKSVPWPPWATTTPFVWLGWWGALRKGAELSYKLGYVVMAALFRPVHPVHPDRQGLSAPISRNYLHQPHYKIPSLQCSSCSSCSPWFCSDHRYYLYWSHYELISL